MQHAVVRSICPIFDTGSGSAGHDIDIGSQFAAVLVERQIVDVVTKGILNLGAAKGESARRNVKKHGKVEDVHLRETEDNVGGEHGARYGNPVQVMVQLEWQD